jgi:hypothetical protein
MKMTLEERKEEAVISFEYLIKGIVDKLMIIEMRLSALEALRDGDETYKNGAEREALDETTAVQDAPKRPA